MNFIFYLLIFTSVSFIFFYILQEFFVKMFYGTFRERNMLPRFKNIAQQFEISFNFLFISICKFLHGKPSHHFFNILVRKLCTFNTSGGTCGGDEGRFFQTPQSLRIEFCSAYPPAFYFIYFIYKLPD